MTEALLPAAYVVTAALMAPIATHNSPRETLNYSDTQGGAGYTQNLPAADTVQPASGKEREEATHPHGPPHRALRVQREAGGAPGQAQLSGQVPGPVFAGVHPLADAAGNP